MDVAAHPQHWDLIRAALRGVEPSELLARAGAPPCPAPMAAAIVCRPRFIESVWRDGVRWQPSDLEAPLALVHLLRQAPGQLMVQLPLFALLGHAGAVRRMIGGREQQALRAAVGARMFAAVLEQPITHASVSAGALSASELLADAPGYLEREGARMLACACAAFGDAWLEVLRLRLPMRFESILSAPEPLPAEQARGFATALIERVQSLWPA
jgi:YOP proteins translocation protein K (YscK)